MERRHPCRRGDREWSGDILVAVGQATFSHPEGRRLKAAAPLLVAADLSRKAGARRGREGASPVLRPGLRQRGGQGERRGTRPSPPVEAVPFPRSGQTGEAQESPWWAPVQFFLSKFHELVV